MTTPTQVVDTLVRFLIHRWEEGFVVDFDESLKFVKLYATLHGVEIDTRSIKRMHEIVMVEQAELEANPMYKRLEEIA